jgi:acyl-CoA thioester hydrolase
MAEAFEFPVRVYYEDTDAGGVVFYANYLRFFERARTEWLRSAGISQSDMTRRYGVMFVVRETSVDFRAPARLDDWLTLRSQIERLGRVAVTFHQEAWREIAGKDELLATSVIKVGCVDRVTFRPTPIPDDVRSALKT